MGRPGAGAVSQPGAGRPSLLHLAALALLSAGMLAFEVLLLRLFEFSHWHHFAGFAISLALLGLGAAGTALALLGRRAAGFGDRWLLGALAFTAAGLMAVLWLQSRIALRPLFAVWDAGELWRVVAVDLAAFLPFFAAGLAIGQVFMRWPEHPGRLYGANLLGSALGSMAASVLLAAMNVETALACVAAILLLGGALAAVGLRSGGVATSCLLLLLPAALMSYRTPSPAVSDFKALSRVTELPDVRILETGPGLRGRLTVARSDSLRFAPGLSLQWSEAVPSMDAAVLGSDRLVPLARRYGDSAAHLAGSLAGLALELRPEGAVLALGSATWSTPAQAGARNITWVEADGRLLELARERGAGQGFRLVRDDAYRFLATTTGSFAVASIDSAFAGGDASTESYLMTASGLAAALSRLEPGGLLVLPMAIEYPPRQAPRAMATLKQALERGGASEPGAHVAALRGLQDMVVLASPTPLGAADLDAIRKFAERWRFDTVWLAGTEALEANRFHRLDQPVFHQAAAAVFGGAPMPDAATWFETAPADLGRPYFWRAMRWSRVPDLVDAMGRRALSHLDWTLILSALAAVLVVTIGFLLILAPLGRLPPIHRPLDRISLAGYFTALGIGYLFLELAVFQRAILFLEEPVLTASVVFAVFLAGSGIGSLTAPAGASWRALAWIHGPIALGFVVVAGGLWVPVESLLAPVLPARALLVALLALPLAFALGRPFPWGLQRLSEQSRWTPWAWGINGFASVLGASLAPLVSVHLGQGATLAAGAGCYLVASGIAVIWVSRSSK